jgi:hypothetical protein
LLPIELKGNRFFVDERWWSKSGVELGDAVWTLGTTLRDEQASTVETRALECLRLYDGRRYTDLTGDEPAFSDFDDELDYNLSRAACDTVHAEIAGRQKPMAKFLTSGGDWKTKRKARKMEKYCHKALTKRQGNFLNSWELMESVFLDSTVWGMGVAKVFARDGRIKIERHLAHELFVDRRDAYYGNPQSLFHVYTIERDLAIKVFADDSNGGASKEAIRQAINAAEEDRHVRGTSAIGTSNRVSGGITIVEGWRLPIGDEPGKHVFAIQGALLHSEDWDRPEFPFVLVRWDADRIGWRAKGLVEHGASIHMEVSHNARKLKERFDLCGHKRTYYVAGSVDENALESNEAEVFIPVTPGAQMPQETTPKPIADAEMMWMSDCYQRYFEITGVSQARASARKEAGVTAGVALRTLNDMQTIRFSLKAKAYENAFVQLTNQILYCAKEMAIEGYDVEYDDEVDWSNIDIDDTLDITVAPTSALPNDMAGRMQMAAELFESGVIKSETYKQLLGWPDIERETSLQNAQVEYIEQIIDEMLDGGDYEPPDPHIIDKAGALLQVSRAYLRALYDRAPEDVLSALSSWITEMDELMARGMARAAQAQATAPQFAEPGMAPMPAN